MCVFRADWVHRFVACSDYMHKLLPIDVTQFIDAIVFVPRSLQQLPFDARREIVRRTLKYSRQISGKKKKPESVSAEVTWDDVSQHLQQSLTHLKTLPRLLPSADIPYRHMPKNTTPKLWQLLLGMVVDGQCPTRVDSVLQVVRVKDWSTRRVVSEAVALIVVTLRQDPMEILQRIIDQVSQHQNDGGTLVGSEDVMSEIRPFCSNSAIEVKLRLSILKILEQSFSLSDEDLQLLILYRTQAVVAAAWPDLQVAEDNISSDGKRSELFYKLLDGSTGISQFLTLSDLLKVWPPLSGSPGQYVSLYCH
ncbi:hypothetical protein NP493_1055g01012 [Ridgeia piscesae]|uniref:NBAS subunit of NRZ tethering complex C-terminal domain-containing protein n=1 Tax=Ridgeia piscesae TaxID=27915 RepID=A0AAD9NLG4_RIDPI|nr:hypothetical protein NP493_1055g01012 [Ridgeia piscesae]